MSPNLQTELYQFAAATIHCIRKHWVPKLSDLQQQACIFCSRIFKLLEFCWSGLGSLCWVPTCRIDPDILYGSLISPGLATQAFYFYKIKRLHPISQAHFKSLPVISPTSNQPKHVTQPNPLSTVQRRHSSQRGGSTRQWVNICRTII